MPGTNMLENAARNKTDKFPGFWYLYFVGDRKKKKTKKQKTNKLKK